MNRRGVLAAIGAGVVGTVVPLPANPSITVKLPQAMTVNPYGAMLTSGFMSISEVRRLEGLRLA